MNIRNLNGRIRTVTMNDRGQIVIPEEIRKDLGLSENTTLVLIDDGEKIFIQKEIDILTSINEDNFWRDVSRKSLLSLWDKKDEVWNKFAAEDVK